MEAVDLVRKLLDLPGLLLLEIIDDRVEHDSLLGLRGSRILFGLNIQQERSYFVKATIIIDGFWADQLFDLLDLIVAFWLTANVTDGELGLSVGFLGGLQLVRLVDQVILKLVRRVHESLLLGLLVVSCCRCTTHTKISIQSQPLLEAAIAVHSYWKGECSHSDIGNVLTNLDEFQRLHFHKIGLLLIGGIEMVHHLFKNGIEKL